MPGGGGGGGGGGRRGLQGWGGEGRKWGARGGRGGGGVRGGGGGGVGGVVTKALAERGVEGKNVVAAVGPSIGADAFEVGAEVVEEFRKAFGERAPVRVRADGKGHVDLKEAIRRQ